MTDATHAPEVRARRDDPAVRTIDRHDIADALRAGFEDFKASRADIAVLAIVYPLVVLFAARLAFGYDVLPLVFPILSGMTLLGPIATLAFDNASRRREAEASGATLSEHPRRGAILAFAGLLTAIFFLWLCVAWAIFALTIGPETPASAGAFASELFTTGAGWELIVAGNLAGLVFALAVLGIGLVSFPLILDRSMGAGAAMRVSVKAALANPGAVALWGLAVAVMLAAGSIPLFIGLAVAIPVLGHASWHLYRKLLADA